MPPQLSENVWTVLLEAIRDQRCTPFLGTGASFPALPLGSTLARTLAEKYHYPFDNATNLTEVAQYLAVEFDPLFPKSEVLKIVRSAHAPAFDAPDEPHAVLAGLPLPIYITTNYDDFLFQALKAPPRHKDALREFCLWNDAITERPRCYEADYKPTVACPLVFHLHGHTRPESLVLTEDDYLTFLANIARNPRLLPPAVERALDLSNCLFIGYRLADWNFRVLFQGIRPRLKVLNVAVLKPSDDPQMAAKEKAYLDKYYAALNLHVYWGTARDFAADLKARWEAFPPSP